MDSTLSIRLNGTPEQLGRLRALQTAFAEVCNALAPVVQQSRCWHRVTLHHMTYKPLRERFPEMGSQMVCNAIYSVCRASRVIFQHPASPFHVSRLRDKPLPLLRFAETAPVYFDRHTLSLKGGQLSMYTLDGRIHFQLALRAEDEQRFREQKLREIVLSRTPDEGFQLAFTFGEEAVVAAAAAAATTARGEAPRAPGLTAPGADTSLAALADLPEHVLIEETA